MKRILKKNEKGAFEKFRTNFFMIDLYPENNKRFDMSYASVKALSSTLTNKQNTIDPGEPMVFL